jgi:ferredoxin
MKTERNGQICIVVVALYLSSSHVDGFLETRLHQMHSSSHRSTTTQNSVAGTGALALVDMNQYNLPNLETVAEEWTANVIPKSSMQDEGIYLGARSSKDIMVDTVKVDFPRKCGLGLELLEIAGGREDGLGITVVSKIVPGGAADGSGVIEGDSISQITLCKQSSSQSDGLPVIEDQVAVVVECLGWDKTVEAIQSLPSQETDDETIILTLKRLRRKPKVQVTLQYPPEFGEDDIKIELFAGENLRRALLVRGVKLNDAFAERFDSGGSGDCGAEGTCATCAVEVRKGQELLSPAKTQEAQIFAKKPRWRMACKAIVGHGMQEGELTVRLSPRQWKV